MKVLLLVAVLAISCRGILANANCDDAYECKYTYPDPISGDSYSFDMSDLCSATDFKLQDAAKHTYYANICGSASQNCLPANWRNTYEFGVAVQTWGSTPPCTAPGACTDNQGNKKCCTADCQVLGTGPPTWSIEDPSNPTTGGIRAAFLGAAASDSDPFWCMFNPATGAQYEREVHFVFQCDESIDGVSVIGATQNSTNDCRYTLTFATSKACASNAVGGGWDFIIVIFVLFAVYVIGGMAYVYVTQRRLGFPNAEFWSYFADLVRDGFLFVGHGCKKHGAGSLASAGAYDDIGAGGAGGSATASYTAGGGSSSPKAEPYTDL